MKHTTHILLSTAIFALTYLCVPPSGFAKCSGEQIEKLVDKGFSREDIKDLCSGQSNPDRSRRREEPDPEPVDDEGMSTTCKYSMGPKAGRTQYFRPGTPGLTPAMIGGPCTDGMGSFGEAIPDRHR